MERNERDDASELRQSELAEGRLTRIIIGAAYRVYNAMGFGYLESVYEKCMMIELGKAGVDAAHQQPIDVTYCGEPVGHFIADLLVGKRVIVELKSIRKLSTIHEAQLVNYLVATGLDVGLLINFGEEHVAIRRKVRRLGYHPVNPVILSP